MKTYSPMVTMSRLDEKKTQDLGRHVVEPGDITKHPMTTLVNFITVTGLLSKE